MTLPEFFRAHPRAAIGFSGGVDSSYLLYEALRCGAEVCAYFVRSPFQPQFELDDARRLADELGARMRVLSLDVLADPEIAANPPDRCYFCKRRIFAAIQTAARADGYDLLLDGTNASDDIADRPGFRALRELEVLSPLRACALTKEEVRRRSRAAGLFTWDKPAYACLATRIPAGRPITAEALKTTEQAEGFLSSLGFRDFRIRMDGSAAKLQLRAEDLPRLLDCRAAVLEGLRPFYSAVTLDLEVRK